MQLHKLTPLIASTALRTSVAQLIIFSISVSSVSLWLNNYHKLNLSDKFSISLLNFRDRDLPLSPSALKTDHRG